MSRAAIVKDVPSETSTSDRSRVASSADDSRAILVRSSQTDDCSSDKSKAAVSVTTEYHIQEDDHRKSSLEDSRERKMPDEKSNKSPEGVREDTKIESAENIRDHHEDSSGKNSEDAAQDSGAEKRSGKSGTESGAETSDVEVDMTTPSSSVTAAQRPSAATWDTGLEIIVRLAGDHAAG